MAHLNVAQAEICIGSIYTCTHEGCSTLLNVLHLVRWSIEHHYKELERTVESSVKESGKIYITLLCCVYSIGTKTPGVFLSTLGSE